ncbi:unnamed protein product [Lampetra fluviatilis]
MRRRPSSEILAASFPIEAPSQTSGELADSFLDVFFDEDVPHASMGPAQLAIHRLCSLENRCSVGNEALASDLISQRCAGAAATATKLHYTRQGRFGSARRGSIVPWLLLPLLMAVLGAACLALLQEQQRRATVTTPLPPQPPLLTSGAAAARFDCDRWPRDETSLAAVESPPDAFSRDARMAPSRGALGQVRLEASRGGLPASEESSSLE